MFQSEAQEQEMVKMSSFGGGIGSLSREGRLREAAKIYIQLGNLQRYCELMVELGEVSNFSLVLIFVHVDFYILD